MYVPTGRSRCNSLSRLHIVGVCKRVRSSLIPRPFPMCARMCARVCLALPSSRFLLQSIYDMRTCISRVNVRQWMRAVTETSRERTFDDTIYILYIYARTLSSREHFRDRDVDLFSDAMKECVFDIDCISLFHPLIMNLSNYLPTRDYYLINWQS